MPEPGKDAPFLLFEHRIGLFLLSLFFLVTVFELVRRGQLKERYALLWLGASLLGLVVGAFPALIAVIARAMHFQYLTVLFFMYVMFMLGLVLSFTVVISRLAERNRELTQEVALLATRVRDLEQLRDRE